jgi:hypothetical protein
MPYTVESVCPNCGKKAKGKDKLEELFRWRKIDKKKTIPQSYCRACRKKNPSFEEK